MVVAFYISYFVLLAAGIALLFINERCKKVDLSKIVRILAVVLVVMTFINVFLPDLFAKRCLPSSRTGVLEGHGSETYNFGPDEEFATFRNPFHAIVRAFNAIGVVSIPFAIFYKKPYINKVVTYLVLPFSVINSILFFQYIGFFTSSAAPSVFGEGSRVILQNGVFRTIWFGLLNLIQTLLAVFVTIKNKEDLTFHGIKEVGLFAAIAVAFLFTNMPIYTAQHVFGTYTNIILTIGYPGHFIFIGAIAVEVVALFFLFRNQSYENKYILMFVMALSLLFQYNEFFNTDGVIAASRWPLQLCNIAGAFIIVTLLTKSDKFFHFTLVVNSLGAFIAIAICDSTFNTGILYEMNIHYMVEHINVLLVPIMCGLLKLFKPLKAKDVKHVWFGFTIYWAAVLLIGTWLCSYQSDPIANASGFFDGVNYLFMFDKAKSVNLVGFAGPLFDESFKIGNWSFYLVQPVILLVFEALCTGVYFVFYSFLKEKKNKNVVENA